VVFQDERLEQILTITLGQFTVAAPVEAPWRDLMAHNTL